MISSGVMLGNMLRLSFFLGRLGALTGVPRGNTVSLPPLDSGPRMWMRPGRRAPDPAEGASTGNGGSISTLDDSRDTEAGRSAGGEAPATSIASLGIGGGGGGGGTPSKLLDLNLNLRASSSAAGAKEDGGTAAEADGRENAGSGSGSGAGGGSPGGAGGGGGAASEGAGAGSAGRSPCGRSLLIGSAPMSSGKVGGGGNATSAGTGSGRLVGAAMGSATSRGLSRKRGASPEIGLATDAPRGGSGGVDSSGAAEGATDERSLNFNESGSSLILLRKTISRPHETKKIPSPSEFRRINLSKYSCYYEAPDPFTPRPFLPPPDGRLLSLWEKRQAQGKPGHRRRVRRELSPALDREACHRTHQPRHGSRLGPLSGNRRV